MSQPEIAIVMGSKSDWATMSEATQILAMFHPELAEKLQAFRQAQTQTVLDNPDPRVA